MLCVRELKVCTPVPKPVVRVPNKVEEAELNDASEEYHNLIFVRSLAVYVPAVVNAALFRIAFVTPTLMVVE
jgi:hypothetical protein